MNKNRRWNLLIAGLALITIIDAQQTSSASLSDESSECIACHEEQVRGIFADWNASTHSRMNVGCYECHQAQSGDPDLFEHEGYDIAIIVSPTDCARCHPGEVKEFSESHHAKAGMILGSLDNFLADIVEGDKAFYGGSALTVSGCQQCHGAVVEVNPDGSLKPTGWPNTGMGRLNPDGSAGACTACHQRHAFSKAQARRPENCGKCHLGPDHPQLEIYEESKHGIAFAAHSTDLNMEKDEWVLGEDYTAAPTCATCHMSAVRTNDGDLMPVTHDIGMRISWNNRPPVSIRPELADQKLGLTRGANVDWQTRRATMKAVCGVCHTDNYINNFYEQYDGVVNLYNSKFGRPGMDFMELLYQGNLITATKFDEPVEWTWWEIWHHEGRVARHGASMMAPDYTHWHGLYEVGKHWYSKFIPELRDIAEQNIKSKDRTKAKAARGLNKAIDELLSRPEHIWYTGKLDPAEVERRQKAQQEFYERYKN